METTCGIIKPDAIERNLIGNIISIIEANNFIISRLKLLRFSEEDAKKFYEIHTDKQFFNNLIKYMTSGNIIAMTLDKENAIKDFRTLLGATDPEQADENTIRKLYALDVTHNAVHGSDSSENAKKEISFIFSK